MATSASSPTRDGDFYAALGLQPSATAAEIKSAYRRAALDSHPDRPGGDGARFRSLGRAYAVLSDGAKRTEYDARRGTGNWDGEAGGNSSLFAEDGVVEVDLSSLGVVDAALLSVFGRLGVAIRAAPPPAVLEAARTGRIPEAAAELSWANAGDGAPLLRPLSPSAPGAKGEKPLPAPPRAVAGSVARGQADWYRITLPPRPGKRGGGGESYAIAAHSRAGSRLKLLLFEPGNEGGAAGGGGGGGGVWELAASADSVPFVSACAPAAAAAAAGAQKAVGGGGDSRPHSAAAETSTTTTNGQLALLVASDSFPTLEMKPAGTAASLAASAAAAAASRSGAGGGEPPRAAAHACGGVFRRLDGLASREPVPPADPGTELLIAVVGANTFRRSSYSLRAVLLPPSGGGGEEEERRGGGEAGAAAADGDQGDARRGASAAAAADGRARPLGPSDLLALRATEEALLAQRRELSSLEGRHRAARAALDAVAAEAAAAGARVEALLRTRDDAYARVFCLGPTSNAAAAAFAARSSSAGGEL